MQVILPKKQPQFLGGSGGGDTKFAQGGGKDTSKKRRCNTKKQNQGFQDK